MYVACGLKAFPPLPTRLRPWVSFSALRPAFMDIRKSGLGWMNLPSRCFAVQMDKRAVQSKKNPSFLIIFLFSGQPGACHFCHSCHCADVLEYTSCR